MSARTYFGSGSGVPQPVLSGTSLALVATVGGSVITVPCAHVKSTSLIFLTFATLGADPSPTYISAITAGTSFTIKSSSATDTSTMSYLIINPV